MPNVPPCVSAFALLQGAALDALSAEPPSADAAALVSLAGKAALHWACSQAGDAGSAIAAVCDLADGAREMAAAARARPDAAGGAAAPAAKGKVRNKQDAVLRACFSPCTPKQPPICDGT